MNATITHEQTAFRTPADIYPKRAERHGIGNGIIEWLGRIAERSGQARRAESYRRLNALNDSQLAAVGIRREELLFRCFGGRALL